MITGTHEQLTGLAKSHQCPEHDALLGVAWSAEGSCYVLRCGAGHYPEEVIPNPSLTEMYRQGTLPDGPITDNIERREQKKHMAEENKKLPATIHGIPTADLATGEVLAPNMIQALVNYARKYKLDPERGHIVLMYGKPYITIDGYLYHANKAGIKYSLISRPMSTEELQLYKIGATDHAWIARAEFTEEHAYFTGVGIVTYDEMSARSNRDNTRLRSPVVAAHPWQLAQKRAEWQALRRAFPIGETVEVEG